jgi:ribonuclease HI
MTYTCFFDGATTPNPGQIGLGVAVFDEKGVEVLNASGSGGHGTNNVGEYKALIWAMKLLLDAGVTHVNFCGDSNLVVQQVMGFWEVKHQGLKDLHHKAQALGQEFQSCKLEWVPRAENARADALSKAGVSLKMPKIVSSMKAKEAEIVSKEAQSVLPVNEGADQTLCIGQKQGGNPATADSDSVKRVKVIGLAGNKIAFIYSNDVVVLDVNARHCSCAAFAAHHECEHIKAVFNRLRAG